ncbi:sulfotransferase domain-containing protein [Pseudalkalibacillus berkeleyi]|uniref:Sulfotransferase domain-containing protein n=1 Tax=Pseudalkalibacillus berkeleyi TaxID=1069813 RepID=A0ABS9GYB7_9BACL|nr:sulfotransferase domain-containing protein [Pseudalkalibacillus berkeleyi]MCF6136375.1 sulfotransferase domain-containing protein [Pseudalkalibacillus berkeleyi]
MSNRPAKKIQPFFVNSIPKSGTHLMKPLLEGIPNLKHHAFLFPGRSDQILEHKRILSEMSHNHFSNGHIFYSQEYKNLLKLLNIKQLFLYRDPRDIVVSYVHFFDRFPDHQYKKYFNEKNLNLKERLLFIINGSLEGRRQNINNWYHNFLPWRDEENVLAVKYEDLVHSPESQKIELRKILKYFNIEPNLSKIEGQIRRMQSNVDPNQSPTYRKGQSGNWKQEFDEEVKAQFKKVTGELLIDLGYEKDMNW